MNQTEESSITPEEYQKYVTAVGRKEIAQMPKGSPEQFKAQCERLKAQTTQEQDR